MSRIATTLLFDSHDLQTPRPFRLPVIPQCSRSGLAPQPGHFTFLRSVQLDVAKIGADTTSVDLQGVMSQLQLDRFQAHEYTQVIQPQQSP